MYPKPCSHCGVMFMPRNVDGEFLTICNNCQIREDSKKQKGEKKMSFKIMVDCPQSEYAKIEEIALNQGISPSEYFIKLHKLNLKASSMIEDMKQQETKGDFVEDEILQEEETPKKSKSYKKK